MGSFHYEDNLAPPPPPPPPRFLHQCLFVFTPPNSQNGPPPTPNTLNQYKFSDFHDIQYFSNNLAYYAPIMLILEPVHTFSKISTSTEDSVWLEALRSNCMEGVVSLEGEAFTGAKLYRDSEEKVETLYARQTGQTTRHCG